MKFNKNDMFRLREGIPLRPKRINKVQVSVDEVDLVAGVVVVVDSGVVFCCINDYE